MRLLLDTHTLIWFLEGSSSLSNTAQLAISSTDNEKYISVVSLWEMSVKQSIGKFTSTIDLGRLPGLLQSMGVNILSVQAHHAVAVKDLPYIHGDPFDRLLIVQAQLEQMTLVTKDRHIHKYDDLSLLW